MNPLHLFEGFGVEIEYMIVSDESLDICPIADRIIHDGGNRKNDVSRGAFSWSNELVLHVLEMKCSAPVPDLSGVAEGFMSQIREINQLLIPHRARLLPSAMHPWMDPFKETHLWPHGNHEIYHCFDRIFDCRGHGWSNLQSTHLNLPFSGDDEFRRLHSAIRLVLPFIVAMAASSPFSEGSRTGNLCQRMVHYAGNCRKIPAITGLVVPDVYRSEQEYQEKVFDAIEAAIRPLDPEGILEPEWTNARGAIARFSRGAIEIRVMDTQEAPVIDLAILQFVVQWLKQLVGEEMSTLGHQESVS
ncbi:MAG: glutamate-cysteine ligase family protein, partial [Verrucomicrobia bacterium]|nr:glutamate-cysteine ligase family protein [Verrucomicrobiota bacterium]